MKTSSLGSSLQQSNDAYVLRHCLMYLVLPPLPIEQCHWGHNHKTDSQLPAFNCRTNVAAFMAHVTNEYGLKKVSEKSCKGKRCQALLGVLLSALTRLTLHINRPGATLACQCSSLKRARHPNHDAHVRIQQNVLLVSLFVVLFRIATFGRRDQFSILVARSYQ